MAQRAKLYYLLARKLFMRRNGPMWGQFMAIGGATQFSVPCSPDEETRWVRCYQNAAHGRAGMGKFSNIDYALPDAP